jgi:hypothetical protein
MKALELLRERLLKDKEIFPHYNEYINGILSDIDNELLAMEKQQIKESYSKEDVIKIVEKSRETGLTAEYLLLTFKQQEQ